MNYIGIHQDHFGGMTETGRIIRDAWVFEILPEEETCTGWNAGQIERLYDKVHQAWLLHGHLVSRLPPPLREQHARIYGQAIQKARELGWDAELGEEE
jgi:hypothetical protein